MYTIIDLCLLCLTNNTNQKSVVSKDSDGVIVKEKLISLLSKHIKIEPGDSMLHICLPCLEKLNFVYNYKRLCVRNINRFNYFIHKLKSTDDSNRNLQVTLIDINIKQETCENELNSDSITTENCNVRVDNPNENEIKHRQKPEVVGETLAKESNEMRYVNISDNIENNKAQEKNFIKEEVVPNILDDEIKYEFVYAIVKEETKDNYDAIDVKAEFNDAFFNGTDNNEESTSNISPESADKSSKCGTHLTLCHTGEKPFKCDICNKAFCLKKNLVAHKYIHTGEKPFKCDVCDKTFSQKINLMTHKYNHTGERPYKCDICDKKFTYGSGLVRHKRCHTGDKPYKCDTCDKTFSNNSNLAKHKRVHTGEKPYKCDICDKKFTESNVLVRHKRCHTGEKPYKCDICDKTFGHSSSLVTHKYSHTGEKPYKCDVCDKTFRDSSSSVKHKRRHTGDKPKQNI